MWHSLSYMMINININKINIKMNARYKILYTLSLFQNQANN